LRKPQTPLPTEQVFPQTGILSQPDKFPTDSQAQRFPNGERAGSLDLAELALAGRLLSLGMNLRRLPVGSSTSSVGSQARCPSAEQH